LLRFSVPAGGAGETERADQRRQSESLKHERHQDDAECEKDDQLALREGRAVRQPVRQRNRGRERDDATHSGPADDKDLPRRRQPISLMKYTPAYEIRQARSGKNPDQAQQDEKRAEDRAIQQQFAQTMISGSLQDVGKLQSKKHEHQSVEDESQRIPNCIRLQT